jgi:hypothetical protein
MLTNWMTTVPGVLLLLRTLWDAWTTKTVNWNELQDALIALGLIAAKDWNVTGGSKIQD